VLAQLPREASVNAPDTIRGLAEAMREAGIKPELEVFDSGMAYLACELLDRGILEAPFYANVILGGPNTAPARAGELAHLSSNRCPRERSGLPVGWEPSSSRQTVWPSSWEAM
jgi:uncharacterized protein (DUF849 family)